MKKVSYVKLYLCNLLMFMMISPQLVFATGATQSNAVSDIMNNSRFAGAISSIEWLTTRIDYWFTMVITATAFFIISAALLKNACAGAYCANPKFWNKVAEAHEKSEALQLSSLFGGGLKDKFMNISTSGIKDMLLMIVPNIKAFTDFDDADIEPKQYFMKAIPQMLACIIIGVFIYNGYYRDTAATVGNFGSEICNRFFGSIDPAAWVDKLTQTTSKPECIYDNDPTLEGKYAAEISQAIYKAYISISKGLTGKEQKASLMRDAEWIADGYQEAEKSAILKDKAFIGMFLKNDTRQYDYTLGNLKIVPCPQTSAKDVEQLHITEVDKETHSKYSCYGYYPAPETTKSYVSDSQQYFYVSFVMTGSTKTNTNGISSLKATAGSWSSSFLNDVDLGLLDSNIAKPSISGNNRFKIDVDKAQLFTSIKNKLSASDLEKYCSDKNLGKYSDVVIEAVDPVEGQGSIISNGNIISYYAPQNTELTKTVTARCVITYTPENKQSGTSGKTVTNVRVTFKIKGQTKKTP